MQAKFVIFLAISVTFSMTKPVYYQLTWQEFVDIIEDVPENERYDFIHDNYLKGYRIISEDDVPLEKLNQKYRLAVAIFKVIVEDLSENASSIKSALEKRREICFPNPVGCIDPNDPGLRP